MTREPTTISQEATISTVAEIMLEKKFSGLPVVDDQGKLVGIITESDIFRAFQEVLSAGAAATSLVFAAHALGFAASWLTEWYAYDRRVLDALGIKPEERIAGFVHIGRQAKPAEDRPRPPLGDIVTRYGAP